MPFVRSPYNYDGDIDSHKSGLDCSHEKVLTQQHMRDECDINVMVQRFAGGVPIPAPEHVPGHADFSDVMSFQDAMNVVIAGERAFAQLPSKWRKRFENDPAQFLDFVNNPDNRAEAEIMGIVRRVPPPEPQTPPVASSEPAPVPPKPGA